MEIATGCSTNPHEKDAALEAAFQLKEKIGIPSFLFVLSTVTYDNKVILQELKKHFPETKIVGGTSCIGIITDRGYCSDNQRGLGLFGIQDDSGCYGIAARSIDGNPQLAGQEVIREALNNAKRPGESPAMILVTSAPGQEEALIDGMMSVVGKQVPIFGGTSADNSISGLWQQFCGDQIYQDGIMVAAIYSSRPIGYAFHNGYMPTEHAGTITSAQNRVVSTIDNKPAADVYNQWTEGVLEKVIGTDANILGTSTFFPLGREVGKIGNIPYYTLSHPNALFADGSMSFFSTIQEGDKVVLMSGTKHSLKTRIERVIHLAKENYSAYSDAKPKGAFIVYCAGCFLAIKDEIQDVIGAINAELPSEPYLVMFSFGEQGCLFGGENHHGNLMISAIIFG